MGRKITRPPKHLTSKPTWNHNHYVPLFDEMLDSPAFVALSHGAKIVYLLIAKEHKGDFTGDKVICPYSTMEEHGIRTQSISKWLRELEALGFIRIDSHGGLYKIPNEYRLLTDWQQYKDKESAKAALLAALKKEP